MADASSEMDGLDDFLTEEAQHGLPDSPSVAQAADLLTARARERLGATADVRVPVLRVLLQSVLRGVPRERGLVAELLDIVRLAISGDDEALVMPSVLRCLLLDELVAERFLNVAQAFHFSGALSVATLLAWDARLGLGRQGLPAHDPRQSQGWYMFTEWLKITDVSSDDDDGDGDSAAMMAAGSAAGGDGISAGGGWEAVGCTKTAWQPSECRLALYVALGEARETVVVLDGLVCEQLRAELLDCVTAPGWDHSAGPPPASWARATADGDGLPRSWGLKPERMEDLKTSPAAREVHTRLCALYPGYTIVHMPEVRTEGQGSESLRCTQFVGNATIPGDCYRWHVDADPSALRQEDAGGLGGYVNGEIGKPLFVSLLVYLNPEWRASWDGETLFRDPDRCTGVLVQPLPGRAILMVQDVLHRASAPSESAPAPRYSLVWKLLFVPAEGAPEAPSLCRTQWGRPAQV
ncbi:2OG-Fe(II) oxygenase superfamily-domain-containing protein [Pavlovales sp. CCMP2436]|nr:2OG-Fe(II) oxygenase superfamily-domain-containing protein [Pavlovales sp. CCMP2436]